MADSLPLPFPGEGAELARHVEFVRRLARGMTADAAASEDLAQETWLATLERSERPSGSLRAWLARVLRNRAALALRRGERRARREAAREPAGASAPTAELVERMELHSRVVEAVLALPAEYREVVARRYFAGEETREIARQLDLSEATVRTRLTRAHVRLRHRLEAHFGGSRALAFAALADLARDGAPVSAPLPLPLSLALSLAMKKTIVAVVTVALLALLALWSSTREDERGVPAAAALPGDAEVAAAPGIEAPAVPAAAEREELVPAPPAERPEAPARPASEESTALDAAAEPEPETAWLEFHVRDPRGFPVPEARVRIQCYRTRDDRGSSVSLESMPETTTDTDGIARLEYPRRLGPWDGPERPEIGEVCYVVEHPDFVTVNDWEFDVDRSPAEVVLRQGALLIVAGFLGERSALVTDVVPHLSDGARVRLADWNPTMDGRPSCSRLPAGRHAIYLTRAGEGGTWASEAIQFEIGDDEVKELTLELFPPRTLRGQLDPLVPRPVQSGAVELSVHIGTPGDRSGPRGMRVFRAEVQPDGSFEIPDLPPGTGEMIGMCDGWVSREIEPLEEDAGKPVLKLQQVDPAAGDFVLAMERTARLEVQLLDPDGEPVEGALVQMSPNVHWSTGYSRIFLEREWMATSDASGRVEIENLPPGKQLMGLVHADLCLPPNEADPANRWVRPVFVSGETTALELRLVPKE